MAAVNWSDLRANAEIPNNDPVPPGPYPVRVSSVEPKITGNGKTMIVVTFEVTSGPQASRKIWNNMVMSPESPKAMGFFFKDMATMGADDAFFAQLPAEGWESQLCAKIQGFTGVVTVRLQRNDPTRTEVARIQAEGEGTAPGVPAGTVPSPGTVPAAPALGAPQRPF